MPIHPTAIVDSAAKIHNTATIGPYVQINGEVEIGAHCYVAGHCQILGPTVIGKHNKLHFAGALGDTPQDIKYKEEEGGILHIGDHNIFREGCVIHRSVTKKNTRIGDHNFLMIYAHVGHDCHIGCHNIFGCHTAFGGHTKIGNYTNISAHVAVHQYCRIGDHAHIGGGVIIIQDIAPYLLIGKSGEGPAGINVRGLKRNGFDDARIRALRAAYRIFFRQGLAKNEAIKKLNSLDIASKGKEVENFVNFLEQQTERGVAR